MAKFNNLSTSTTGDPNKDFQQYRIELERRLRHILRHIDISSIILGLNSSRLVSTDSNGDLASVSNLANWIAGTTKQITISNDGDGTITISTPQNIDTNADVTFDSAILNDLTASRILYADASKKVQSITNLADWISGTSGNLTVTNDGDGTITLKSIGNIKNVTQLTDTDTLTVEQQGFIECNKATAMTVNLPTAVGNDGLGYSITNINTGTVTIDPNGAETIQGDSTFDLYEDENIQIVSNGTNWTVG